MDARGVMEPNDKPQAVSRAEKRKQRRVLKRTMKPQTIAEKKLDRTKGFKTDNNKKSVRDQRAGRQINQAMKKH